MLQIDKLKLTNFIVYKKQTFNFSEMFDDTNLLLIYGKNLDDTSFANDNGAGKSIIYEALLFLLCNRTTRNSNKNLLIGKFATSMNVEGTLLDDSGTEYWIKRYRKNKVYVNGVRFKINGKEIKKGTPTELSNFILNALGISYRRIINTSIFESNDERSRLIYLGDKDGKSLLSQMKGLGIFNRCEQIAKDELKDVEKNTEIIKNDIDKLKTLINRIKNEKEINKKLSRSFEKDRKEKISELKNKLSSSSKLAKKEEDERNKEIENETKKLNDFKDKKKRIRSLENTNEKLKETKKSIKAYEEQITIQKLTIRNNKQIVKDLKSNREMVGSVCDYCGNEVKKKNLIKHLEKTKRFIRLTKTNLEAFESKLNSLKKTRKKLERKIDKRKKTREANNLLDAKINSIVNNIETFKKWLEKLEKSQKKLKKSLKKSLKSLQEQENTHEKLIRKLDIELSATKKDKNVLKEQLNKLKIKFKYKNAWYNGYGKEEIQSFALQSTVNELNEQMSRVSEELTNGTVDIKLLTQKTQGNKRIRNVFEFSISDLNKKDLPFKEWSKGQKKRIEIIVSFALMNLENSLLMEVFLDELFDGIDQVGIVKIKEMLERRGSKDNRRFIIFSHSNNVKQLFTNKAYVELKNGRSRLWTQKHLIR